MRPRSETSLKDRLDLRQQIRNLEVPDVALTFIQHDLVEPKNFNQAMSNKDSAHWNYAVRTEYGNIAKREVWKTIDSTQMKMGMTHLTTRWVSKIENDGRYRAPLVVRGFTQVPVVDFEESHSPVANAVTIRLLLVLTLMKDWVVQ
jgi:Reverse transcriptase (RNA-dependent DNA polymerase)